MRTVDPKAGYLCFPTFEITIDKLMSFEYPPGIVPERRISHRRSTDWVELNFEMPVSGGEEPTYTAIAAIKLS